MIKSLFILIPRLKNNNPRKGTEVLTRLFVVCLYPCLKNNNPRKGTGHLQNVFINVIFRRMGDYMSFLYVNENGAVIGIDGGYYTVKQKDIADEELIII